MTIAFGLASARGNYILNKAEFYLTFQFSTFLLEYGGSGYSIHLKTNHLNQKKVPEEKGLN